MLSKFCRHFSPLLLVAGVLAPGAAHATCTLPNTITNGQTTDASQVMGNFSAVTSCIGANGTVNTGTAGQVGYYAATGNQVSGESVSNLLDTNIGTTQGSILYRSATGWQSLAPGTSGYVLSTNGAGSDPSWVIPGKGSSAVFPNGTTSLSSARSAHLSVVTLASSISVNGLACVITTVTGATYQMGIAGWDPVNLKLTSAPVYTTPQTVGTGAASVPLFFSFSSAVPMSAGTVAIFLVRTDGTTTTNMTLNYGSGFSWGPQLNIVGTAFGLTSQAPTTSDVWTGEGARLYDFAISYNY